MVDVESACPSCSLEFGVKFKCEHCGDIFCDLCNAKQELDLENNNLLVKFLCPSCGGPSTRIPIRA